MLQQTLKEKIEIKGVGLHSGCKTVLTISPATENTGICFQRNDLLDAEPIRALYTNVIDTRNCTCIGCSSENFVSTIEHIMAVLYVKGVDNALISVDNPEVPILDGSGKVFLEAFNGIELQQQKKARKYLRVKKEINFTDANNNSITLFPADNLYVQFDIDFPSKIVGHQEFQQEINPEIFAEKIAPSRTFCEKYQVDYLKSIGLIKGGSLENAVVLDGEKILNPEGFRVHNECVNHKVLDAIGDLYTSGYYILAKVVAHKTGHYHNNEVLKKLFASSDNYEVL